LKSKKAPPKDLNNTKFKERFYTNKKNLQSIMTKISKHEKELLVRESLSPKMYEYVGMADNYHRRWSDEWQTTS